MIKFEALKRWAWLLVAISVVYLVMSTFFSVKDVRDDAIDFKDQASDQAYQTLKSELERSQAQVEELQKQLDTKDSVIGGLNRSTGRLAAMRNELELELQSIRSEKEAITDELNRYKLNYTQEAIKDVKAVERTTNDTISTLMREYDAITREASGSATESGGNN